MLTFYAKSSFFLFCCCCDHCLICHKYISRYSLSCSQTRADLYNQLCLHIGHQSQAAYQPSPHLQSAWTAWHICGGGYWESLDHPRGHDLHKVQMDTLCWSAGVRHCAACDPPRKGGLHWWGGEAFLGVFFGGGFFVSLSFFSGSRFVGSPVFFSFIFCLLVLFNPYNQNMDQRNYAFLSVCQLSKKSSWPGQIYVRIMDPYEQKVNLFFFLSKNYFWVVYLSLPILWRFLPF